MILAEGFAVEAEEVKDAQVEIDVSAARPESSADDNNILRAHAFFQTFKCLFADLILSFQDRDKSQSFFQKLSHEDAFNVIAIELGRPFNNLLLAGWSNTFRNIRGLFSISLRPGQSMVQKA
ncbi:hypothetical protein Pint_29279 [Pistacia integerrima]|uniref:Uncharacterized protein n=1 Tax=Pistacia integerrima TaxID=434235 RepID=A0ACC0X0N1_9ROSI|nr:hypothetical protein Pint_29279 [Pistacia integerrima]